MFTGLVSALGEVRSVARKGELALVRIAAPYPAASVAVGASIACGGPCLTAIRIEPEGSGCCFEVEAAAETLARTTAGRWRSGDRVNLERSLKIGDELGGHLVTGHIDGLARVLARSEVDGAVRFDLRAPASCAPFIAEKGSVALDGTSLTVNSVTGDDFSVLLIPHTLAVTTWSDRGVGDEVNLEVDLMARYAARLSDARRGLASSKSAQRA